MKPEIRKLVFVSIFILFGGMGAQAQDVVKYFTEMPAYLLPSLENSHKLELIENYTLGKKNDTVANVFGGKISILHLDTTAGFLSLKATSVSRFDMKIFKSGDKTDFIAVINTVCGPVCSSYIRFYNTDWKEIRMEFPVLSNEQWLKSTDKTIDGVKLKDMFKTVFLEYHFNTAENAVDVTNNSVKSLGKAEQELLKPFLMEDKVISVKWKEGKWKYN